MEPQQPYQPALQASNVVPPTDHLSRLTIVIIGFILAFIIPLAGLIVSIIARRQVIKRSLPGRGLALAGIIIGGIFTAINMAFIIVTMLAVAAIGG